MKNITILTALAFLLISCAHGKTDSFPTLDNPADNAHVYVIRDNNLLGWGFSLKVALDEAIVAGLRSGEYVSFYVKPGFHSLGISKPTMTVAFEKGRKYYFLVSADFSRFGFDIERIDNEKGESWLAKTKQIE